MIPQGRFKWYIMGAFMLVTAGGGLILGKLKEHDYMSALYERRDFTLLDDNGDFFRLNSLPEKTLALLVFTPDGIPTDTVKAFHDFSRHLDDLRNRGIETMLVSRTNREIVKNFKRASGFNARLLLDVGGIVGRNSGVWEGPKAVTYWAYALVDRNFRVHWTASADSPMAYERLLQELKAAR